jgi:3-oxoacid CoA-transferase B subunit
MANQAAGAPEMSGTKGLNRQQMADRVAREFQDGWIVNLGVGIPTMCSNTDIGDTDITYHSENGVIGYGPVAAEGHEDLNLVNAGGQNVTLKPGAAVVHHADSFGVIRGGHIDATVMGAYQVAMNGDFANWKLKGQKGGGIGGAMDLAACAKRVFIILEHVTRDGGTRLVTACDLPVTARGVVTLVATNYGLFEPTGTGFRLREIAPGLTVDEIRSVTGGILTVADGLREIAGGG